MKIAVISDIHGNALALDAVLKQTDSIGVDGIYCLGDILMAGYDPNYTGAKILELKNKYGDNFEIIQGNTDKMIACYSEELFEIARSKFPCMGYALKNDLKIINTEYVDFVRNLPENKYVNINGIQIQLVHGSPRKQDENIYPNLNPHLVEEMVKDSSAGVIFCGHTHIPCGYSLESGKTVVNVGSIGRSMTNDRMPCWALLRVFEDGTFEIEHKSIKYDNIAVSNFIKERDFPHSEDLAKMYLQAEK